MTPRAGTRARLGATLAALLACCGGCSSSVFHQPVALSTKSDAVRIVRRLGPVAADRCDISVLIVPVSANTADAYDELLAKARNAGGNAVVDFQRQETTQVMVSPLFSRLCWRITGTAAVVDGGAPDSSPPT